jgi:hypothetical protein
MNIVGETTRRRADTLRVTSCHVGCPLKDVRLRQIAG